MLLVLAVQKIHREMNALELAAFDGQIARLGRAGAEDDGVKFLQQFFRRIIFPDFGVADKLDALRLPADSMRRSTTSFCRASCSGCRT